MKKWEVQRLLQRLTGFIAKQKLITCTSFVYKTSRRVRISLSFSILNKEFCYFLGKGIFRKSKRKLFSIPVFAWPNINTRGAGRNLDSRKPSTSSWICKTASNSSNPSLVYIRLCKHGKRFLLLKYCFLRTIFPLAIPAFFSRNIVLNIVHFCYLQCFI